MSKETNPLLRPPFDRPACTIVIPGSHQARHKSVIEMSIDQEEPRRK
jgi:hypothetical protein